MARRYGGDEDVDGCRGDLVGYGCRACFAYNPEGDWTSRHQMSVNGRRIDISEDDLLACARAGNLSARKAHKVIAEVREAVRAWPKFAEQVAVPEEFRVVIAERLNRSIN